MLRFSCLARCFAWLTWRPLWLRPWVGLKYLARIGSVCLCVGCLPERLRWPRRREGSEVSGLLLLLLAWRGHWDITQKQAILAATTAPLLPTPTNARTHRTWPECRSTQDLSFGSNRDTVSVDNLAYGMTVNWLYKPNDPFISNKLRPSVWSRNRDSTGRE